MRDQRGLAGDECPFAILVDPDVGKSPESEHTLILKGDKSEGRAKTAPAS